MGRNDNADATAKGGGVFECDELGCGKNCVQDFFAYRTERRVKIQVFEIGLLYRCLQLLAVLYVLYVLWVQDLWAEESTPRGLVEANPGYGASRQVIMAADYSAFPHCGNASYHYARGPVSEDDKRMGTPECRGDEMPEVASKSETGATVSFVTAYREQTLVGWPCHEAPPSECASLPTVVEPSGQCVCEHWSTVYPVGIDKMDILMEHAYSVDEWSDDPAGTWAGGSRRALAIEPAAPSAHLATNERLLLPHALRSWVGSGWAATAPWEGFLGARAGCATRRWSSRTARVSR